MVGDAEARPVPGKGRVSAVFQDRAVEAWLELPCAETRGHIQELPLIAWVTIGLLARDTFALQVPGPWRILCSRSRCACLGGTALGARLTTWLRKATCALRPTSATSKCHTCGLLQGSLLQGSTWAAVVAQPGQCHMLTRLVRSSS